jgi:hypothetical protein
MPPDGDRPGRPESDVSMALAAAVAGTVVLGQIVGAETHSELLLLLAVVAAIGLAFEKLALQAVRKRAPGRDSTVNASVAEKEKSS